MKKILISMIVFIGLVIGGCAVMDEALIPEDGKIRSDTVVMVDAVAKGLAVTGNPYAIPALTVSTILSIVAGAYTTMRKKQEANTERNKAENYRIVTESIVEAIEQTADVEIGDGLTIGNVVKVRVEQELRDNNAYLLGRAIIEAMKEGE